MEEGRLPDALFGWGPMEPESQSSDRNAAEWFASGAAGIASIPALILMTSFAGFGVFCRESGLTLAQSLFMTVTMWALPSKVVLVSAIGAGAGAAATGLAVALASIRLMPMVASWVPLVRGPETPKWQLYGLSHFVAITSWVFAALHLPKLPREARVPYFAGFALVLISVNCVVVAVSFVSVSKLPVVMAAALFFLTPLYFLTALIAAARIPAEAYAMGAGLVLGPLLFWLNVPLDLLWVGLLGGTGAYLAGRWQRRLQGQARARRPDEP